MFESLSQQLICGPTMRRNRSSAVNLDVAEHFHDYMIFNGTRSCTYISAPTRAKVAGRNLREWMYSTDIVRAFVVLMLADD